MVVRCALGADLGKSLLVTSRDRLALFVDVDVPAIGQKPHGLRELEGVGVHEEAEHVSPLPAAEAVPQLSGGIYLERRGLLGVEWAQPPVEAALLLEDDRVRDDGNEVGRITNTLYVLVWNAAHATSLASCSSIPTSAPAKRSVYEPPRQSRAAGLPRQRCSRGAVAPRELRVFTRARPLGRAILLGDDLVRGEQRHEHQTHDGHELDEDVHRRDRRCP